MTSILSYLSLPAMPAVLLVSLFLAKATLLLLLALVGAAALRRASAGVRHIVWIGALAAVVILPALSHWTPWEITVFPGSLGAVSGVAAESDAQLSSARREPSSLDAPALRIAAQYEQVAPAGRQHAEAPPAAQSRSTETTGATGASSAERSIPAASGESRPQWGAFGSTGANDIWTALAALWVIGTLILLARLVLGMATVGRLVRRARPLDSHEWKVPLWEVADRLDLARAPRLLSSDDVSMPFACGVVRPTVVLPNEASGWSDDRRRAVLFHELAHVRRRDLFGHTLGRIACALYWFHPLVWAAARRLRSESERACDDLVLTSGTRASEYAHHLLEIVTGVRNASAPATALAMARRKEFEGRMLAILDPDQKRTAPGRLQAAALVVGLVALTLSVSAMAPATGHRAESAADATRLAPNSAAARVTLSSQVTVLAESTTTRGKRHLAATVPDTGEDIQPGTIQRIVSSAVESSVERATQETADEIASARYNVLLSDRNNFAPGMNSHSLDEVSRAIRTSVRESFGGRMRGDAASSPADSGTTDLLVKLLQSDSDAKVRRTAAWALAQRNERDSRVVTAALAAALANDKSAEVREMAAWGLGDSEGDSAVPALRSAVQRDADERVKTTAAWALGTIGDAGAATALDAAMADPSARVRSRAAWALGQIEPDKAPRRLVTALGDSSDKVRLAAAWALGQIEDPETLSALSQALSTEKDHEIREAELRALIMLGEASDATLQKLLESPDPDVRLKVTRAIVGFRGVRPWPWPMPMPRPMP
jgi:beta-lactamase regulating signal transducer with metallopeptidase domain/HEAT repeat protein